MTGARPPAPAAREAAGDVLAALAEPLRSRLCHTFDDERRLRWTYVPAQRPGVRLADLDRRAHKAVHQLLATALGPSAFAQATTIMGLEEVLDRAEGRTLGRHSGDYWLALFGSPSEEVWAWRFEGHHLSVTVTVAGEEVSPTPLFLGANPAAVTHAGMPVVRPLCLEEDLARAVLDELSPDQRRTAVVSDHAPRDIRTTTAAEVPDRIEPLGIALGRLSRSAAEPLRQLVRLYLARFHQDMAVAGDGALEPDQVYFAWEGPVQRGSGHYYRIHAPQLLVEYDNTRNAANHAHSVVRRPWDDFGARLLRAHYETEH